ncbi:hypothetical protein ABH935_009046 [Catenulispora sp. GAS73]|uniref:hypothetical protein n=1 Tax=Catenulispora sp. GAS73 TaxID=3156269 RepID=UPI0035198689
MSHEAINGDGDELRVARRLGPAPGERMDCTETSNCPDLFELTSGDFAVIGTDVGMRLQLPPDAGCADTERVVVVPREVLLSALRDLSGSV